jgi:predicted nucleotidyltransferase
MIHLTVPSTYTPRRLGGDGYRVWRRTVDPATVLTYDGLPVIRPYESILDCLTYGTDAALLVEACKASRSKSYLTDDHLVTLETRIQSEARRSPRGRLNVLNGPIGQRVKRRRLRLLDIAELHGVHNLRVFGSVARGEDRPDSDLDLLVDLPPSLGLLGLGRLRDDFEAVMGSRVDIVPASDLKPGVRERVEAELIAL